MTATKLPGDPDGLNNDRAAWAGACIQLMSDMTGCEPGQEALGDLLCNLFHWGDRNNITPQELQDLFTTQFRLYREETGLPPTTATGA
jgi:hypothetical protein